MLDGRVLGASQVEYKPFGKPPLKRELPGMQGFPALNFPHDWIQNCSVVDSCCRNIATNFKFAGRGQQETWVGDLRTTLLVVLILRRTPAQHPRGRPAHHPAREAPGRATCPASEPAACQVRAKVGIPRKKIPVLPWEDCSTLFFANGCEAPAARHRSPAAPARHQSHPATPYVQLRMACFPRFCMVLAWFCMVLA